MAPNADVELKQDSKLHGALFGESIRLGPKTDLQIEAAMDLMLTAALDWKVPVPNQSANQGRDGDRDDDDDGDDDNNGNKGKQSTLPKLIQLRAPTMEISATRDGRPVLRITGQAGFTARLEASDRLVGGQWETIAELDGAEGVVEFTDESAAKTPVRFYRVITVGPPPAEAGNSANEER